MHSVIFIIAPMIIARLLSIIFIDANKFTNEEQEQTRKDIAEIKAMLQRERGIEASSSLLLGDAGLFAAFAGSLRSVPLVLA